MHVYAPLGIDVVDHLKRIARFNLRPQNPTHWQLEVHSGADYLERFKKEKAGNVVVISGRNRGKIDYVNAAVGAGLNALVDKPWILRSEDLPKLKQTLDLAEKKGRVAYDMMTERFEITTILQKEMVNDPEVFGQIHPGSPDKPGVYMESVHHLMKVVAGAPNIRPAWFFDSASSRARGSTTSGLTSSILVPWTLWPGQAVDAEKEIEILASQRWPTVIPKASFQKVTAEADFPEFLRKDVKNDALEYFCNTLGDLHGPGRAHEAQHHLGLGSARGQRRHPVRRVPRVEGADRGAPGQGRERPPRDLRGPERPQGQGRGRGRGEEAARGPAGQVPGVDLEERPTEILLKVPDQLRTVHEQHFAEVARAFFGYVRDPKSLPKWEKGHMLAKYYVTTKAAEMSRQGPVKVSERIAPK